MSTFSRLLFKLSVAEPTLRSESKASTYTLIGVTTRCRRIRNGEKQLQVNIVPFCRELSLCEWPRKLGNVFGRRVRRDADAAFGSMKYVRIRVDWMREGAYNRKDGSTRTRTKYEMGEGTCRYLIMRERTWPISKIYHLQSWILKTRAIARSTKTASRSRLNQSQFQVDILSGEGKECHLLTGGPHK